MHFLNRSLKILRHRKRWSEISWTFRFSKWSAFQSVWLERRFNLFCKKWRKKLSLFFQEVSFDWNVFMEIHFLLQAYIIMEEKKSRKSNDQVKSTEAKLVKRVFFRFKVWRKVRKMIRQKQSFKPIIIWVFFHLLLISTSTPKKEHYWSKQKVYFHYRNNNVEQKIH